MLGLDLCALRIPLLNKFVLDYFIMLIFLLPYLYVGLDASSFESKLYGFFRLAAT
jgi:hypothetical protein